MLPFNAVHVLFRGRENEAMNIDVAARGRDRLRRSFVCKQLVFMGPRSAIE